LKNWAQRTLFIIGSILLSLCVIFSGCSSGNETTTEPTTRIVMDKEGNPITIPFKVDRVAPQIGAMAHMTALLGCADKLVATAFGGTNAYFNKIFPEYLTANPKGLSTSNVEEVIASGAQVLYGPITDNATIEKYQTAGIAVVPLTTFSTVEQMKDNIRKIAEILGGDAPKRAEDFCKYYDEQMAYVSDKTANASDVRVMSLNYNANAWGTINAKDICSVYITAAGGINVAADLVIASGVSGGISTEDVIKWNPELIITNNQAGKDAILAEPTFKTVQAVKDGKVYVVPTGTYLWSVRSAEGAMMPLWLAKTIHPEIFTDLDMNKVVRDYYQKFYDYEIPDDEITVILAGK